MFSMLIIGFDITYDGAKYSTVIASPEMIPVVKGAGLSWSPYKYSCVTAPITSLLSCPYTNNFPPSGSQNLS